MTLTEYDAPGRATDLNTLEPQGRAGIKAFNGRGSCQASKVSIDCKGLEVKTADDAGNARTERKNIDGRVVQVTDALGAIPVNRHAEGLCDLPVPRRACALSASALLRASALRLLRCQPKDRKTPGAARPDGCA